MRTNIDIDDRLMREAMRRSGAPTKRAAVEEGSACRSPAARQGGVGRRSRRVPPQPRREVARRGDRRHHGLDRDFDPFEQFLLLSVVDP
jgi:Arc/MetJ family transcription regulator